MPNRELNIIALQVSSERAATVLFDIGVDIVAICIEIVNVDHPILLVHMLASITKARYAGAVQDPLLDQDPAQVVTVERSTSAIANTFYVNDLSSLMPVDITAYGMIFPAGKNALIIELTNQKTLDNMPKAAAFNIGCVFTCFCCADSGKSEGYCHHRGLDKCFHACVPLTMLSWEAFAPYSSTTEGWRVFFEDERVLMNQPVRSEEITLALGLTLEREAANGQLWCPPQIAGKLKRYLTNYAKELDGLSQQAVRLLYAMEFADGNGALGFMYGRLGKLTSANCRSAFEGVRLEEIGRFDGEILSLHEPHLAADSGRAFEISISQMPLIAAFIDAAHNMLGFDAVRSIMEPLWLPHPQTAKEVAKTLRADLIDWLRPGLAKEHYLKQARVMGLFLQACDISRPDDIGDEAILSLWEAETGKMPDGMDVRSFERGSVDGFKTYENAARLVLIYREALRAAWAEREAETRTVSFGETGDEAGRIPEIGVYDREHDTVPGLPRDMIQLEALDDWVSPLIHLQQAPADQVKWLDGKQSGFLARFIEDAAASSALFSIGRPDPMLALTIARYGVFAPFQRSWRAGFESGNAPDTPIAGYHACMEDWERIAETLRTVRLAAAYILTCRESMQGLVLFGEIDQARTRELVLEVSPGLSDPQSMLQAFANRVETTDNSLVSCGRKAYARFNRAGFRKQDRFDNSMLMSLEAGASHITPLLILVEEIISRLKVTSILDSYDSDAARFVSGYRRLYGQGRAAPTM